MKLWHVGVSSGRFIVRAEDKEAAIALARKEAEEYSPTPEAAWQAPADADELTTDGPPAVLDTDYS